MRTVGAEFQATTKRFGGTRLDHKIRAAINDAEGARKRLERARIRAEQVQRQAQRDLDATEETYLAAMERLTALREQKAAEEPGTATPVPRKAVPRFLGLDKPTWVKIRLAGLRDEATEAFHKGRLALWVRENRARWEGG